MSHTEQTKREQLDYLYSLYSNCTACPLGTLGRTQVVFGKGNPDAKIMLIGEAPGADEDKQGLPFVGRSGQLLSKTLTSIGVSLEDVYITNIAKCRPPNNRPPTEFESTTCTNLLLNKQISIIKPDTICTLGATAFYYFYGTKIALGKARGKKFTIKNFSLIPTYHPAYLLRNPPAYPIFLEDLKKVFGKT